MSTIKATHARANLYALLEQVAQSHEPVQITSEPGNAVLISEEDWRSVQATLYLVTNPGMRESIIEGMETSVEECSEDPGW